MQEEIKNELSFGNACYYSAFSLFDENIKINIECAIALLFLVWVWNLVSYIKEKA